MRLTESQLKMEVRKLLRENEYKSMTDDELNKLFNEFIEDFNYIGPPKSALIYIENRYDPEIKLGSFMQRKLTRLFIEGFEEKDYKKFMKGVNLKSKGLSNLGNIKGRLGEMLEWYEKIKKNLDANIKPAETKEVEKDVQIDAQVKEKYDPASDIVKLTQEFLSKNKTNEQAYKNYEDYHNSIVEVIYKSNTEYNINMVKIPPNYWLESVMKREQGKYVQSISNEYEIALKAVNLGDIGNSFVYGSDLSDSSINEIKKVTDKVFSYMTFLKENKDTLEDWFQEADQDTAEILEKIEKIKNKMNTEMGNINSEDQKQGYAIKCMVDASIEVLELAYNRFKYSARGTGNSNVKDALKEASSQGLLINDNIWGFNEGITGNLLEYVMSKNRGKDALNDLINANANLNVNDTDRSHRTKIWNYVNTSLTGEVANGIFPPKIDNEGGVTRSDTSHITRIERENIVKIIEIYNSIALEYINQLNNEDDNEDDEDDNEDDEETIYYFPVSETDATAGTLSGNTAGDLTVNGIAINTISSIPDPERVHPVTMETSPHNGMDISVQGQPGGNVYAVTSGTITRSDGRPNNSSMGLTLRIVGDDGNVYKYFHLSDTYVNTNDTVQGGDLIAAIGNTGIGTAAHLHLEIAFGTTVHTSQGSNNWQDYVDFFEAENVRFPPRDEEEEAADAGDTGESD